MPQDRNNEADGASSRRARDIFAADGTPADTVLAHIHMLSSRIDRAFLGEVAAEYRVTLAEWRVILTLRHYPGSSAAAIRRRWGMEKMAASRAVRGLEAAGRIVRRRNPGDRRGHVLTLTREGEALYDQIIPGASRRYLEILDCLSVPEIAALRATLVKLVDHTSTLG